MGYGSTKRYPNCAVEDVDMLKHIKADTASFGSVLVETRTCQKGVGLG